MSNAIGLIIDCSVSNWMSNESLERSIRTYLVIASCGPISQRDQNSPKCLLIMPESTPHLSCEFVKHAKWLLNCSLRDSSGLRNLIILPNLRPNYLGNIRVVYMNLSFSRHNSQMSSIETTGARTR